MRAICCNLANFILLFSVNINSAKEQVYNVQRYGAKGDGKHLDTKAIDKAITLAYAAGGATVYFPAGNYLSVTIDLKINVALYIDQGTTIVAATPTEGMHMTFLKKPIITFIRIMGIAILETA